MEKLYNNQEPDISSSAVKIDYYKTADNEKTATKIKKSIEGNPNIIFSIISGMFLLFSIPYFFSFYENMAIRHNTLFYSVPMLLCGILFLLAATVFAFLPFYIDGASVRHYNRYPHKNTPYCLIVDSDGVVVAKKTYSVRIEWREITDIVEHSDGIYIAWTNNRIFINKKYITVEKLAVLRNYFNYFCPRKIRKIGEITTNSVVFPCDEFTMCPLVGELKFKVKNEDSREKYERSTQIIWRKSYFKFLLILSPVIITICAILILISDRIIFAILAILVGAAISEIIFRYAVKLIAMKGYSENEKYSENAEVSIYENAIMYEANGLVRVIEFDSIRSVNDCDGDILVISDYADMIRISDNPDREEMMDYIRIKTMK